MILLHLPVDRLRAEFAREELVEKDDETLADVTVVEISGPVHRPRLVLPVRAPVPLVGAEGLQVIVDCLPDGLPDTPVVDQPLVRPDNEEDVDKNDLVTPVLLNPAAQSPNPVMFTVLLPELKVARLARGEVGEELYEVDQTEPEVFPVDQLPLLLLCAGLCPPPLDKVWQAGQLILSVNFLAALLHRLQLNIKYNQFPSKKAKATSLCFSRCFW